MKVLRLVAGGLGKPEGFETGYFVKPTIFAGVNNQMTIAQEEIFGPVLTMIPFDTKTGNRNRQRHALWSGGLFQHQRTKSAPSVLQGNCVLVWLGVNSASRTIQHHLAVISSRAMAANGVSLGLMTFWKLKGLLVKAVKQVI